MLMLLKSKLLGLNAWYPQCIDLGIGRSFLLPQAGHGCGRIVANGDEYSILYDIEMLWEVYRARRGVMSLVLLGGTPRLRRRAVVWYTVYFEEVTHPMGSCSNVMLSKCDFYHQRPRRDSTGRVLLCALLHCPKRV